MERTIASIKEKLDATPIALQIAVVVDHAFVGVLDLVELQMYTWDDVACPDGAEFEQVPLDATTHPSQWEEAIAGREALCEALADLDDDFAELVLDDEFDAITVAPPDLMRVLRRVTLARKALPLLCGTGRRNKGIQPLLDAVAYYLHGARF
jgi:elongation factor G